MSLNVVVPTGRSFNLQDMIWSFAHGHVKPDAITLVSNRTVPLDPMGLNVRWLKSETPWLIGEGDQGIRRNIGVYASEYDKIMMFDDDQRAPINLVSTMLELMEKKEFVAGHHRFVDFTKYSNEELLTASPTIGVSRERPANATHLHYSCYAGLLGITKECFIRLGGFDLQYRGKGEDQHLGLRYSPKHFIHEPPFAWHPTTGRLPLDLIDPPQTCVGKPHTTQIVNRRGTNFVECSTCGWTAPHDDVRSTAIIQPYDHAKVKWEYVPCSLTPAS